MLKYFLSFFIILYSSPLLHSFNYNFNNINSDLGLSQNNVKSILQDSHGFLWFGTKNKLNRYDGTTLKIFDCYDYKAQKGNNNIGVIFESKDQKLWLGTDKGIYLFDPKYEHFTFFDTPSSEGVVISDWISSIQEDQYGNIWIIAPNQGVFRYNESENKVQMYTVVDKLLPSVSNPQCIALGEDGSVWIGTNGSGVFKYNRGNDNFTQHLKNKDHTLSLEGKNIYSMQYFQNSLFIAIHEEKLLKFDINKSSFTELPIDGPDPNYKIIRHLSILNKNELWVGTQFGIYIINLDSYTTYHIKEDIFETTSLSDNLIETIYQDKEGNIWIGTGSGGVDYLPKSGINFSIYSPSLKKGSLLSRRVRELIEDDYQNIWIGTEDAGVFMFNPKTSNFQKIKNLHYSKVLSLMKNEKDIWAGFFKNGLDIISIKNDHIKSTYYSPNSMGLNEESIYALHKDRKGNIWLGNAWGVFFAPSGTMRFERQTQFGLCYTFDIMEDRDDNIWIATMGRGVFKYNPETNETIHFVTGEKENTLSSNSVSSITEDHLGQIWFSTDRGGICVYNKNSNDFKRYSIKQGLPDDVAYKIIEDKEGNLWFGTNKGLVKFNPIDESINLFTKDNGLPSNQFNYKSGLISSWGDLFFGTSNGMISFNPYNIKVNNYIPPVYITGLSIFNDEVNVNNECSILKQSLLYSDKLVLPYNKTNITLSFVSLSYTSPQNNQLAYKMENVDEDWITASQTQTATYSNLSPGKYIFKVKGSNNDGLWNPTETCLEITVTPPWWKSSIAKTLYLIGALIVIFIIIRTSIQRYTHKIKQRQEIYRIKQEKDLYEEKVNFFTNVAHEIRSPLTLIHAPLESLLEMNINNQLAQEYLEIIEHNTQSLLSLVNQLLDFNKVSSKKVNFNWQKTDIIDLVNQTVFLFKGQTARTNKSIEVHTSENTSSLIANVDKKEFSKILNNLISNALKYSDNLVDINIDKSENNFTIHVKNDGKLIPEEYREKIFEPFFRVKDNNRDIVGSGIGLSLAMSLTNAHNGSLQYTTNNDMNNFILTIPLGEHLEVIEEALVEKDSHQTDSHDSKTEPDVAKVRILLVDDNKEIVDFLKKRLSYTYNILTAYDGVEALEILSKEKVDIVISDIMMPNMDGFELCSKIKKDEQLNYIIVLLLTAKSDLASKIKGLELGADAYVEKPFSIKYLTTLINTQIANKIRDSHTFRKKPIAYSKQINMNKADEDFVNKLNNIIQENIGNSEFNVIVLAKALNISRSGLHRKITEILNVSPVEYIRLSRLQKAAELISEGKYRINEIAYMVGINTPSYFIKIFQAHYGMTPKEYEEHIKDNIL